MAKTETIRARVEPELKHQAEELLRELGLSATEAITLFYKQVTMHRGLPFEVKIPNSDTTEALRQAGLPGRMVLQSDHGPLPASFEARTLNVDSTDGNRRRYDLQREAQSGLMSYFLFMVLDPAPV